MTIMERLTAQLHRAAQHMPVEELASAQGVVNRLRDHFAHVVGHDQQRDAQAVLDELRQASQDLGAALTRAHQIVDAIERFACYVGVPPSQRTLPEATTGNLGEPASVAGRAASVDPPPSTFDPTPYLDQMPRREPPRRGQPRQKTHGRWIRSDGTAEKLLSGEFGDDYQAAYEHAWNVDLVPRPWRFDNASHVEIKVATRMYQNWVREQRPQHETIVINNRPCWFNPLDCEYVIGAFLPPGSTLTVHAPDGFRQTYRAKEGQ